MSYRSACAAFAVLFACPAGGVAAEPPTAAELKAAFSGYEQRGLSQRGSPIRITFNPDGTLDQEIDDPRAGVFRTRGTWRVEGHDAVCTEFPVGPYGGGGVTCRRYEKDGQGLHALDDSGARRGTAPVPLR